MDIRFCWWNVALSPNATKTATKEEVEKMILLLDKYLVQLLSNMEIDFLALGEINPQLFDYINSNLKETHFEVIDGMVKIETSRFNECFIYNTKKLLLVEHEPITGQKRERGKHKVAQKLVFKTVINEEESHLINVLTSHWPSGMNDYAASPNKHQLALLLRDEVDLICEQEPDAKIVLMGDYNEEPHSPVIQEHLRASRDVRLVEAKSRLLYNPLWKSMSNMQWNNDCAGSYFYSGGDVNQWLTFDQIIISKALLVGKEWQYKHDCQNITELSGLVELVRNRDEKFDHLPVFCHLQKVHEHG